MTHPLRPRPGPAGPRALRPGRHRRPRAALAADRRQGVRPGPAQPLGPAQRRAEEADAHHGRRRLRPAQPADRRAARRGPDRHRPAPAAPAPLRRRPCSTRRIVESVVGRHRPRRSTLEVADDLPEIHADPDKFTQVVTNLVENAVRHGEGTVRVTLEPLGPVSSATSPASGSPSTTRARASPPRCGARVFTKFWKGGKRGGSGLGLYIVGGLTKVHGGTVTHRRRPGGGARITVAWPSALPDL